MFIPSCLAGLPPPSQIAPLFAIVAVFGIPILFILTKHQQKMTMLMRGGVDPNQDQLPPKINPEIFALHSEVHELKEIVASLVVNVDHLKDEVRSNRALQERVKLDQ